MTVRPILFVLASLGCAAAAQAGYTGPTAGPTLTTVRAVLEDGADEQLFTVTGHIVNRVGDEKYNFRDETGTILAEIDDKYFMNLTVDDKTTVELQGEVERDLIGAPELDVKRLTVLQPGG